jgi:hypothetical protein
MRYKAGDLDYTRIGLGDPNNSSLSLAHCQLSGTTKTCFYIMKNSNLPIAGDICSASEIPLEEIEDYQYMQNEPLLFDKSRDNRVLISKTNNLMPNFLDNLLKYLKYNQHRDFSMSWRSIKDRRLIGANRRFLDNFDGFSDRSRLRARSPHRLRDFPDKS